MATHYRAPRLDELESDAVRVLNPLIQHRLMTGTGLSSESGDELRCKETTKLAETQGFEPWIQVLARMLP